MIKVFYHANCNDGSAAALAAWLHFKDKAEYHPINYGTALFLDPLEDAEVYFVDFSLKRDELRRLANVARRITIIDHHDSAQRELDGITQELDNVEVVFDMAHSGAMLAWDYFHTVPPPTFYYFIEDRDLFTKKYEVSDPISRALQLEPDWKSWIQFFNEDRLKELVLQGHTLLQFQNAKIEQILRNLEPTQFLEYNVPVVSVPGFMVSDTLHAALNKFPECLFAVNVVFLPRQRQYSLRTNDVERCKVNLIAERFGGGGHPAAAGFTLDCAPFIWATGGLIPDSITEI